MAPYFEHYEGDVWWDIVFAKTALDEAHSMFAADTKTVTAR
jgi:hypothetical protein